VEEVAATEFVALAATGERWNIRISIAPPRVTEHGDWCCHANGEPLVRLPRTGVVGSDSMQALTLAIALIKSQLQDFIDQGGKLLNNEDGDDEYPLDAMFGSKLWTDRPQGEPGASR
jgi:hypothetical protein